MAENMECGSRITPTNGGVALVGVKGVEVGEYGIGCFQPAIVCVTTKHILEVKSHHSQKICQPGLLIIRPHPKTHCCSCASLLLNNLASKAQFGIMWILDGWFTYASTSTFTVLNIVDFIWLILHLC